MDAQYNLGALYYDDDYDCKLAVFWLTKAAEQGQMSAQYLLGTAYLYGDGVAKNEGTAVLWFRKSAEQGDAYAQNMLGNCYYQGIGVPRDLELAEYWYQKAREQGHDMDYWD